MNKKISTFLKIIISLVIIAFLINKIGWHSLISTLASANILILSLIIPLKLFSFLFTTFNIKIFLDGIKKKVHFGKLFVYTNLAWAIGLFFPGRIGEFSLVYFLKEENITFGESGAVALLDKISTFIVLTIFSILAILKYFNSTLALRFAIIAFSILVLILFLLSNAKIRTFFKTKILKSYSHLFSGFNTSFKELLVQNKKLFFFNLIITTIKWSCSFLIIQTIFLALGISVNFIDVCYITAFSLLISLIPLSIGGLGVREGVAVYLFNIIGIKPEITLSAYLINTALNYVFGAVFVLLNLEKVSLNKEKLLSVNSLSTNSENHIAKSS